MTSQLLTLPPKFYSIKAKQVDLNSSCHEAASYVSNLPDDFYISCQNNKIISTNKVLLSLYSPMLRNIFSDPCINFSNLILPGCSSNSVRHFLNIISTGLTSSSEMAYREIAQIILVAKALSVEITSLDEEYNGHDLKEEECFVSVKDESDKSVDLDEEMMLEFDDSEENYRITNDELVQNDDEHKNHVNTKPLIDIVEHYRADEQKVQQTKREQNRKKYERDKIKWLNMSKEEKQEHSRKKYERDRRRLQKLSTEQKHRRSKAHKMNQYLEFLKYCFNRSDVEIDVSLPMNEKEKLLLKQYGEDHIYLFFFDYFRSLKVQNKEDGSMTRPMIKTIQAKKSQVKTCIIEKLHINLADPLKFPNHNKDWREILENISDKPKNIS